MIRGRRPSPLLIRDGVLQTRVDLIRREVYRWLQDGANGGDTETRRSWDENTRQFGGWMRDAGVVRHDGQFNRWD